MLEGGVIREALAFYASGQSDNGVLHKKALEALNMMEAALVSFLLEEDDDDVRESVR